MPEKKRVAGVVDRVEGHVAVIVVRDPSTKEPREIYVDKKKMKKVDLKEGDAVSVEMSRMAVDTKKDTVRVIFMGLKAEEMAKKFFIYLVDGGLEDQVIQTLSGKGVTLGIEDYSKKSLSVLFECSKEKPAKKVVKKLAKKPVKGPVKVKKPVKKVSAKRGKKA